MSLIDDVMQEQNAIGKEIEAKRAAEAAAHEAEKKAEKELAEKQKRHEEDKKQGML